MAASWAAVRWNEGEDERVLFKVPADARGVRAAEDVFFATGTRATWLVMRAGAFFRTAVRAVLTGFAVRAFATARRREVEVCFAFRLLLCLLTVVEWFFAAFRIRRGAACEELAVPPVSRATVTRIHADSRVRFLGPVKTSLPFHSGEVPPLRVPAAPIGGWFKGSLAVDRPITRTSLS
jgi:hypothetical protein